MTEDEMVGSVIKATNMNLTQLREAVEDRRAWHVLAHGITKSRTQLNDNKYLCYSYNCGCDYTAIYLTVCASYHI